MSEYKNNTKGAGRMRQIGVTFNHKQVAAFIAELGSNDNPPRTSKVLKLGKYVIEHIGDNVYKVSK